MKKFLFIFLFFPLIASAGVVELSALGNYRKVSSDEFNYTETQALTGSIAYYFWAMSALELSYTSGTQKSAVRGTTTSNTTISYITLVDFVVYGADLVITLASPESAFKPYMKVGAAYQVQRATVKVDNVDAITIPEKSGTYPSAGVGFKLDITKSLAFKAGADAVFGTQTDISARAGLSWMF